MMAAEVRMTAYRGLVTILAVLSLSSGDYVRRGSNITDGSMKCTRTDGVLELYRQCGGEETRLLELWCENMWSSNHYEPRLHLNPDSGCWNLTDAEKDDSCVYNVVYYGKEGRILKTFHITVLDPVLISNITSNSSRLGQDIAVSVQFSGEETAVTWEVDGGPLPDRYRLMDDNRTLIIPSAQRGDGGRRLRVRITNPISEETREYQLEITDLRSLRYLSFLASGLVVLIVLLAGIFLKKRKTEFREMEKMNGACDDNGRPPRSCSDPPADNRELLDPHSPDARKSHTMNGSGISAV